MDRDDRLILLTKQVEAADDLAGAVWFVIRGLPYLKREIEEGICDFEDWEGDRWEPLREAYRLYQVSREGDAARQTEQDVLFAVIDYEKACGGELPRNKTWFGFPAPEGASDIVSEDEARTRLFEKLQAHIEEGERYMNACAGRFNEVNESE